MYLVKKQRNEYGMPYFYFLKLYTCVCECVYIYMYFELI